MIHGGCAALLDFPVLSPAPHRNAAATGTPLFAVPSASAGRFIRRCSQKSVAGPFPDRKGSELHRACHSPVALTTVRICGFSSARPIGRRVSWLSRLHRCSHQRQRADAAARVQRCSRHRPGRSKPSPSMKLPGTWIETPREFSARNSRRTAQSKRRREPMAPAGVFDQKIYWREHNGGRGLFMAAPAD